MTAYHFVLTEIATGRIAGHALICPDVWYAAVRWHGTGEIDRRSAKALQWARVRQELSEPDWPKGYVDLTSAIARFLVPAAARGPLCLQFVSAPPVDWPAVGPAAWLDGYLEVQVLP